MKYYTLLMSVLFAFQAMAVDSSATQSTQAGTPVCRDGSCNSSVGKVNSLLGFARALRKMTMGAQNATEMMEEMPLAKANQCSKFVDDNQLSVWGKLISNDFKDGKYAKVYAGASDFVQLCPKYPDMTTDDKDALHSMTLAMWSFLESTCTTEAKLASAPNGTAKGLLQLHFNKEEKYSGGCRRGDSLDANRSLRCGLSMLDDQIERDGLMFSPKSYWEVLRPQNNKIRKDIGMPAAAYIQIQICNFDACGAKSAKCNALISKWAPNGMKEAAAEYTTHFRPRARVAAKSSKPVKTRMAAR